MRRKIAAHEDIIKVLQYLSAPKLLATGSLDKTIRLYNIDVDGSTLLLYTVLHGHRRGVEHVSALGSSMYMFRFNGLFCLVLIC